MKLCTGSDVGSVNITGMTTAIIVTIIIIAVGAYVAYQVNNTAAIPQTNQFYNATTGLGAQMVNPNNFIFLSIVVIVIFGSIFAALGLGFGPRQD